VATIYCRSSDGSDADNGSTWALAKATLAAAITAAGNGGIVYVAKGHTETNGTFTFSGPTSVANTCRIIAVDDTSDPEPPTSTVDKDSGTHPTLTVSSAGNFTFSGFMHFYGIEFYNVNFLNSTFITTNTSQTNVVFEKCYVNFNATGSVTYISCGGSAHTSVHNCMTFINSDFGCAASTTGIFNFQGQCAVTIMGGAITAQNSSQPGVFYFGQAADRSATLDVRCFDASSMATASALFYAADNAQDIFCYAERIKIPASLSNIVNLAGQIQHSLDPPIQIHCIGTGTHQHGFYEASNTGVSEESTAIYRDGGASYDGTNGFSVKMTSSAYCKEYWAPHRFKLAELKLDLTSSKTLTVHTCQDSGTVLQDDEFWIEVWHPDSTDLALGKLTVGGRMASPLATPANLTASSETWTGDAGGADHRKVSATISSITGASDAQVTVYACLGKPSTALYVCPKVVIS